LISIYGASSDLVIVEENGVLLEKIWCDGKDVLLYLSDESEILAQYSIKKSGVWSLVIQAEGYGEYDLTEYDEKMSQVLSDTIDVDAELDDYVLV
jgi:hypothetical protein